MLLLNNLPDSKLCQCLTKTKCFSLANRDQKVMGVLQAIKNCYRFTISRKPSADEVLTEAKRFSLPFRILNIVINIAKRLVVTCNLIP